MLSLGLLPDFREEGWHSMDLVADMLAQEIAAGRAGEVFTESLVPRYRSRFVNVPAIGHSAFARNIDRVLNRMRVYPAHLRSIDLSKFDAFHVCDHSYANLVHALPAARTGVFCHDLDTFRCLLAPKLEPRPRWFKAMMRNVRDGFEKAAVIFHTTDEIRAQILAAKFMDAARLVKAPLGVSSAYTSPADPAERDSDLERRLAGRPFVIHVGSTIPRKRIEVLLEIFAGLKRSFPDLALIKVGGVFTREQTELMRRLNLERDLIHASFLGAPAIADLYRRAVLLLQPSDAEGFGLPVIEALACGCAVVASAIPTLMEVGGTAATYCPVGAVDEWIATVSRILNDPHAAPAREERLKQAARFSWTEHARIIVSAYRKLVLTA